MSDSAASRRHPEYADARVGSREVRDYLIDPAYRFLGLSSLHEQSAVDFLFLARNMGKTDLFNSPGGIDTLVRLLLSDFKVETDAPVTSVEEGANDVTISYGPTGGQSQTVTADACVLAVPGPLATKLHPAMGVDRAAILDSVVYTPAMNVYVGLDAPTAGPAALILIPQLDYPPPPDATCGGPPFPGRPSIASDASRCRILQAGRGIREMTTFAQKSSMETSTSAGGSPDAT